jgi:NAD(P)-dependent dehydrogenase (short-subunit alcohol dehydrogenase family)
MIEKAPASSGFGSPEKIALVTGASRRIGRVLALGLARAGWHIGVHYRSSADEARGVVEEIESLGRKAVLLPADLADADAVQSLIPRCADMLGAPSCLINNASLFLNDTLATLDIESWQSHMDANLRAPVFLSRSFAETLPADRSGVIINVIDQRVLRPSPDFFSYSVSKSGLWWVTQTMAQALSPRIRVNAVAPGPALPSIHQTADEFEAEAESTLLGRSAPPEDIADAVLYLVGASSVTGQMLTVDSGQHLAR